MSTGDWVYDVPCRGAMVMSSVFVVLSSSSVVHRSPPFTVFSTHVCTSELQKSFKTHMGSGMFSVGKMPTNFALISGSNPQNYTNKL